MSTYYAVMASLPHLPHFRKATRLPINPTRLSSRIQMLMDEDAIKVIYGVYDLLSWRSGAERLTDAEVVERARKLVAGSKNATARGVLLDQLTHRGIIAAMRMRKRSPSMPPPDHVLSHLRGPIAAQVLHNWTKPWFGLENRMPWLVEASEHLEAGRSFKLEALLLDAHWNDIVELERRAGPAATFTLDALILYVFKWSILHRWLRFNSEQALARFDKLVDAATDNVWDFS